MKMYKEIALLLLFLVYVSTEDKSNHSHKERSVTWESTTLGKVSTIKDEHLANRNDSTTPTQEPGKKGSKGHIIHPISGPVVAGIVFAAIAGIVGIILLASFLIHRLTRKKIIQPEEQRHDQPLKSF